jgi:hypothetical protein
MLQQLLTDSAKQVSSIEQDTNGPSDARLFVGRLIRSIHRSHELAAGNYGERSIWRADSGILRAKKGR